MDNGEERTSRAMLLARPLRRRRHRTAGSSPSPPTSGCRALTNKLHTQFGTVEVRAERRDALSNLDFAFMAALEARHERWGLVGDLLYVDLSSETDTPLGADCSTASRPNQGQRHQPLRLYPVRAGDADRSALDVGGGFRAYSFDIDTTLEPGTRPGRSFELSEDWVDPLIAARGIATFNERWSANAVLDYGGFDGENDSTWQALASVNYAFNDRWSLRGGWRYLDIQKEMGGLDVETELNGPIIGVGIRF